MAKVLVLGANGSVGSKLVPLLLEAGEQVKAATKHGRTPAAPVAEAIRFDFEDPSTFDEALYGVDRIYLLSPGGYADAFSLLGPFLEKATARRSKIVLQSAIGVEANDGDSLRRVERRLERSGSPFVILRPNWFMDNFHRFARESIRDLGVISAPVGDAKTSFIDTADIAACALTALRTTKHDGRAFTLTGPEPLGYGDVASILSKAIGKSIRYEPVTPARFVELMKAAGATESYAELLASIYVPVSMGLCAGITGAVEQLTRRAPRRFADYATAHADAFR